MFSEEKEMWNLEKLNVKLLIESYFNTYLNSMGWILYSVCEFFSVLFTVEHILARFCLKYYSLEIYHMKTIKSIDFLYTELA